MRDVLTRRGAALVWADRGEQALDPLWATANWGYLRLHRGGSSWSYFDGGAEALGRTNCANASPTGTRMPTTTRAVLHPAMPRRLREMLER